tara:strand:- start:3091 stop:3549 length:459 start_codon:yes stop_codon:yes gene_type:complete
MASSKVYSFNGELLTIPDAAKKYGLKSSTLRTKIRRNPNANLGQLISNISSKKPPKQFKYKGDTKTIKEWCDAFPHLTPQLVRVRLRDGTPLETKVRITKTVGSNWSKPMPFYREEDELKNRIKAYKKKGMSHQEIYFKIKNADFSLERKAK